MRRFLPLLLVLAATHAASHPRELVLAGGALHLCSTLAPRDCDDASVVQGERTRREPRYRVDDAGLEDALTMHAVADRGMLAAWLHAAGATLPNAPVPRDALVDALRARCIDGARPVRCRRGVATPWDVMDDAARDALLAAFEQPDPDAAGARRREVASLAHGARGDGAAILRTFVDAAARRSPGRRPRIAVVTASAFDPFDPVDVYVDALTQAGADVEWWPVDRALAAAVLDGAGCDALPRLRRELLQLPGRERVYADLVRRQHDACRDPDTLRAVPARVQGMFFTGGDQWRLRRAFFDADDRPNAWLLALRDAVGRGDVVIAGTSAGSAVQSGGPMVSNGEPRNALRTGAHRVDPPTPGCDRARTCTDPDALTYSGEGLGLAPGLVVDTHFSQRARELRLLQLLVDGRTPRGVGIDETSALHITWEGDAPVLESLGATGAWALDARPGCRASTRIATLHYLAPGVRWRWEANGGLAALDALPDARAATGHDVAMPRDALASRALLDAAQRLAQAPGTTTATLDADGHALRLSTTATTRRWIAPNGSRGVTGLRLELDDARGCAR